MAFLLTAYAAPVTNIIGPLYHIFQKDTGARHETKKLMLALLRTATVAVFFFANTSFKYTFGGYNELSVGLTFLAQLLIHPYAAALHIGFISGRVLLIEKVTDVFMKQLLTLTLDDARNFVTMTAFFHIAQLIDQPNDDFFNNKYHGFLDNKYRCLSRAIANKIYPKPKEKEKRLWGF